MGDTDKGKVIALHGETVRPEWIDYNGHMNVGYYVLAFDHATDALLNHLDIGDDYRRGANYSTFVVESHVTYQQEVTEGTALSFTTRILGSDAKRIHLFHQMIRIEDGALAATNEVMVLHIDLASRRTAPLPKEVQDRMAEIAAAQSAMPLPKEVGHVIAIPAAK
jgi:acyl-CoA thioester hydrolase